MATQTQKWMPLILIGGALWFLSRPGGFLTPVNGNGNGALNGYGEPRGPGGGTPISGGGGPGGPAQVGGTLSGVVIQASQSVGLYAHKLDKYPGDLVEVEVEWNQTTTDFNGNPIDWPSSLRIELGHPTGWLGVGGWDNMNDLLGGKAGQAVITGMGATPGYKAWTAYMAIPFVEDPGVDWDVRVTLSMEGSTSDGSPDGNWSTIATSTHQNAIRTLASVGEANVGGTFDDIWVYQGQRQMKRLSMGQARPPGGIRTGEVRSWPTSNRNTTLPGVQIRVRQAGYMGRLGPGRQVVAV